MSKNNVFISALVVCCLAAGVAVWFNADRSSNDSSENDKSQNDVSNPTGGSASSGKTDAPSEVAGNVSPDATASGALASASGTSASMATSEGQAQSSSKKHVSSGSGETSSDSQTDENDEAGGDENRNYGKIPAIPVDATPQVIAAVRASRTGDHPEYVAPGIEDKSFDLKKWRSDPKFREAFLNVPHPNLVYQPARAGKDVPRLYPLSKRFIVTEQGKPVTLVTNGVPGDPVTFTSFDLGEFPKTRLTTITVVVNEQGKAEAEFLATPGVINDVRIMAASPTSSGQVTFTVHVDLPRSKAGTGESGT